MITEDRYCLDIVQQLSAVSAASGEVSAVLLRDHLASCLVVAREEGNSAQAIEEIMRVVRKMRF